MHVSCFSRDTVLQAVEQEGGRTPFARRVPHPPNAAWRRRTSRIHFIQGSGFVLYHWRRIGQVASWSQWWYERPGRECLARPVETGRIYHHHGWPDTNGHPLDVAGRTRLRELSPAAKSCSIPVCLHQSACAGLVTPAYAYVPSRSRLVKLQFSR